MTRRTLTAIAALAVLAAALCVTTLAAAPDADAECAYNRTIDPNHHCVEIVIEIALPDWLEAAAYDAIYTDPQTGTRFNAVCAALNDTQVACQLDGVAQFVEVPEYYLDANGNLCRHIFANEARTAVADIECYGPAPAPNPDHDPSPTATPAPTPPVAIPVPSFTG